MVENVPTCPLPVWLKTLLAEPQRKVSTDSSAGEKVAKGQRHAPLLSLAGVLRSKGCDEATITAALLADSASRCAPPKPESDIRILAHDVCNRYDPHARRNAQSRGTVWEAAAFVSDEEEDVIVDFLEEPVLVHGCITEISGPRGMGKSNYACWLAVKLARDGKRVLYLDRDNPPRKARQAIRDWGGARLVKVLGRDKVPSLLGNSDEWKYFPVLEYDLVILDSWDSTAEGAGEKDSRLPSIAMAHILDIAHGENGPAVLILMNTVKDGTHSRCNGTVEDRADAVFEVRDLTGVHFSGQKPWWEEMPVVAAKDWASRASRRKEQECFRLGFVASKFKLDGAEPSLFAVEVDFTTSPFSIRYITDEIDREGAEVLAERVRQHEEKISKARNVLAIEVLRRDSAGEPVMLKEPAISLLTAEPCKLKRTDARDVVNNPEGRWVLAEIRGQKGHPWGLFAPGKNREDGGNTPITEPSKIQAENEADFRRPHEKGTAEIDPSRTCEEGAFPNCRISAEHTTFCPPAKQELVLVSPNGEAQKAFGSDAVNQPGLTLETGSDVIEV
jgi:hypothetical protein